MRKTVGRNRHLAGTNATLMHPSPLLLIELGWVYNDGAFVLARTEWFAPLCDVDVGEAVGLHTALE